VQKNNKFRSCPTFAVVFLSPQLLIQAYLSGSFPMADPDEDNQIYWHTPQIRGIIPLDDRFKVSKNLRRLYKSNKFDLFINRDFESVIRKCSELRNDDTWISEEIIDAYTALHHEGFAHSFEAYQNGELVGGLYGVSIGKAFFGESMFHTVTDASKICLVYLVCCLFGCLLLICFVVHCFLSFVVWLSLFVVWFVWLFIVVVCGLVRLVVWFVWFMCLFHVFVC
jgi:leucyl/phenylalanyl-tRNA--protein transferase